MMQVSRPRLGHNFSRAASGYDARAEFQHAQTRRVLEMALIRLPREALIADIGCGTGYFSEIARITRPGWRTIGIDLAWGMCVIAARRALAVNADAIALPFADGTFDAVVSSLCYQWVENQTGAFSELARVLKPGGCAIVATLGPETLCELRACAKATELPLHLLPMRGVAETRSALADAGLTVALADRKIERHFYESVAALIDSMRLIGAGNNFSREHTAFIGPKRWATMLKHYERTRVVPGLPASWEHHSFVLYKPG